MVCPLPLQMDAFRWMPLEMEVKERQQAKQQRVVAGVV
jgi:hypothetical protein